MQLLTQLREQSESSRDKVCLLFITVSRWQQYALKQLQQNADPMLCHPAFQWSRGNSAPFISSSQP